jgi:signal transduction histidine kinase
LTLVVADNGIGFPTDLDFRNTQSLGMQLVNTLVNQLQGTVELVGHSGPQGSHFGPLGSHFGPLGSHSGAQFKITFPRS